MMLPSEQRHDFQDLPQWRPAWWIRQSAAHGGPVIVPMTIVRDDYFEQIGGGSVRAARTWGTTH